MTESVGSRNMDKKLIQIDISSDTVCPWCFVGKKNLDKAISASQDQYDFELNWHPFQLNPSAPKEGVVKTEYYRSKFGIQSEQMEARMAEVFRGLGLDYDTSGLTGNTLDSHKLIYLAGQQGLGKQHDLVEELCLGYFTQGKYIGDRKAGVEGAAEFLETADNGVKECHVEPQEASFEFSDILVLIPILL
ncbi:uncharacterized protein LOC103502411 isoform X5 [Cucumis melo]|uniref:Uncharacterized protein LOC103502411 isoform X5 n=1 Tax=Cucumis melo TaxID=3656 RepID=A0A1S3CLT5_CUCME|nr:uncharacterized protein LOC103502411 isoform X5 [Cucumis melo]